MTRNVAIVHPDDVYREWMIHTLEREGFDVQSVTTSVDPHTLAESQPDIVILDTDATGNPDEGFRLCAELRLLAPQMLIVFVTDSDYECDRVSAYRVGADEFLSKKISGLLLAVRLAALLRRRATLLGVHGTYAESTLGGLVLDESDWSAVWCGEPLNLSLVRLKILHRLCRVPGQVCTMADLMKAADICVEPNTITAHIKAIRDEFRRHDPHFDHIRSERSVGYRWVVRMPHAGGAA